MAVSAMKGGERMKRAIRLGRCEVSLICRHDLQLLGRKPQSLLPQSRLISRIGRNRSSRSLRAGRTGRACAELLKISINTRGFSINK